jgi:cyclin B
MLEKKYSERENKFENNEHCNDISVFQRQINRHHFDINNYHDGTYLTSITHKNKINFPDHKYSTRHKTNLLRQQLNMALPIKERRDHGLISWTELMEYRGETNQNTSTSSSVCSTLPDIDCGDKNNPLSAHEYANDIIAYHRRSEPLYIVPADYMTRQTDINEKMRSILIDWLVEVNLKFKLMPETLYLTISCIDRFLSKKQVTRKNLQLVGVVATLIASKYEEIWAPEVRDFIFVSDKAYNREHILSMEKTMLNALGFQLTVPTAYIFLQRYLKAAKADKEVSFLSQYLVELTFTDYNMLRYSLSQVAASAVYLASKCMLKYSCWSYTMEKHTQYSLDKLNDCIESLVKLQKKAKIASLQAVFRKFSAPKFNGVAKIHHAEALLKNI